MRLAIAGSYGHVGVVLAGLEQVEDVEFVAAARWGPGDAMALAGGPVQPLLPVYDDYRTMLDEAAADVVAVFMPFARLAGTAVAAAQRRCHVFMEKPLATTLADLARLREAVDRAGVQLAACFAMRGLPAFMAIRQAVRAGRIGTAVHAVAQKSYPFNQRDEFYKTRRTYGGTIPWIGIHAIDYVHYCTGQDYRRVGAMASNLAHPSHPGMEDQGGLIAELTGGGTAVIHFDYLRPWGRHSRPWGDDRLRIAGTEGIVQTADCGAAAELMTPDATERLPLAPPRNVFADFVAGLRGQREPLISTAESFRMTEVALKARDAQDAGQFVDV